MKNYAIVENGIVTNVVLWDGDESGGWQPPEGAEAVIVPDGQCAQIGLTYAGGVFEQPAPPPTPAISFTEIRENYFNTEVRPTRERILNRLVGIGLAAQVAGDAATVAAVLTARQALLDITEAPEVLAATDQESLTAAVQSAYHVIIEATPAELRNAFN